jgi:hypothetical protein
MADWDWATWMLVVGGLLICLLPLGAVGIILVIIFTLRRRHPEDRLPE